MVAALLLGLPSITLAGPPVEAPPAPPDLTQGGKPDNEHRWTLGAMAYNGGPLVGPDLFRKFAFRHYRRVCDWLRGQGIEHIGLDSNGRITSLIPLWLDAGIDHLWPFEVQSGMDVVAVRKQYGNRLGIMGGIDKHVLAKGGEVMRAEVDRVMRLVEQGGYLPEIDHSVPPDVSWAKFCDYIGYLKHRLGRG